MKLVTRFELVSKTTPELHALYCVIFNALSADLAYQPEQRNAFASLENIRRELGARPPGFSAFTSYGGAGFRLRRFCLERRPRSHRRW